MKHLLPLLLLFCLAQTTNAQSTFQLIAAPPAVAPPTQADTAAHGYVENLTGDSLFLKWERIVIELPAGMRTQVCDNFKCWLAPISTKNFNLAPLEVGDMIVHFLNDVAQPFDAIIHIKVTNLGDPTEVLTGVYTYSSFTSGTHDGLPVANVKVYPNPTTDFFTLENGEAVGAINMYANDGRLVERFQVSSDNTYPLGRHAAGLYILGLEDKNGRTFQAMELRKN